MNHPQLGGPLSQIKYSNFDIDNIFWNIFARVSISKMVEGIILKSSQTVITSTSSTFFSRVPRLQIKASTFVNKSMSLWKIETSNKFNLTPMTNYLSEASYSNRNSYTHSEDHQFSNKLYRLRLLKRVKSHIVKYKEILSFLESQLWTYK